MGIVFGDIATSPLYTLQECLTGPHGVAPRPANVLGCVSLANSFLGCGRIRMSRRAQ
jgi:K+ transporter